MIICYSAINNVEFGEGILAISKMTGEVMIYEYSSEIMGFGNNWYRWI